MQAAGLQAADFKLEATIGKGAYGEVFKGEAIRARKPVAIKIIDLNEIEDEMGDIQQEIKVLSQCHCPQLTHCEGSFMSGSKLWIVMEYAAHGSCLDLINNTGKGIAEEHIAVILREVLLGLDYLHKQNKIHRDIKAANLLLTEEGAVKIADFGATGQLTDSVSKRQTHIGSPLWMAPEVVQGDAYDSRVDVWSLGITAIELATKHAPLHDLAPTRSLMIIGSNRDHAPTLPQSDEAGTSFSPDFHSFVEQCLRRDPAERSAVADLLQHKFIVKAKPLANLRTLVDEHGKSKATGGTHVGRNDGRRGMVVPDLRGVQAPHPLTRSSLHFQGEDAADTAQRLTEAATFIWPDDASGGGGGASGHGGTGGGGSGGFDAGRAQQDPRLVNQELQRASFGRMQQSATRAAAAAAGCGETGSGAAPASASATDQRYRALDRSLEPGDHDAPHSASDAGADEAAALTSIGLVHTALKDLLQSVDLQEREHAHKVISAVEQLKESFDAVQTALPGGQLTLSFIAHLLLATKSSSHAHVQQLYERPAKWLDGIPPSPALERPDSSATQQAAAVQAIQAALQSMKQ